MDRPCREIRTAASATSRVTSCGRAVAMKAQQQPWNLRSEFGIRIRYMYICFLHICRPVELPLAGGSRIRMGSMPFIGICMFGDLLARTQFWLLRLANAESSIRILNNSKYARFRSSYKEFPNKQTLAANLHLYGHKSLFRVLQTRANQSHNPAALTCIAVARELYV